MSLGQLKAMSAIESCRTRLMRKLLKKTAKSPRVMITDKLYGTARPRNYELSLGSSWDRTIASASEARERIMKRFKSMTPIHSRFRSIAKLFYFPRSKLSATNYSAARAEVCGMGRDRMISQSGR